MENSMLYGNVICYILSIILIVSCWKILQKANKPGWAILIPIYNMIVLLQVINKPWWWILLLLIPGVNLIVGIWMSNLLSKKFGQGIGFTIGLLLLPFVFYPVLGFGNYTYEGTASA